jgi:hypothetical protein
MYLFYALYTRDVAIIKASSPLKAGFSNRLRRVKCSLQKGEESELGLVGKRDGMVYIEISVSLQELWGRSINWGVGGG